MASVLTLEQLSAGYGTLRVLSEVDLTIEEGERVGLVGLNGHGKSTLLRAVVGLVGWRRGEISYRGRSIAALPTHELVARGLVLIPQGDALFPGLTVSENLDSGAYPAGAWRQRRVRRERVLEIFPSLQPRLKQIAGTLSGGERRMLSVGRGLMRDGDLYLIDEPSLGLAPGIGRRLLNVLTSLDLPGRTLILAEQNRGLVEGRLDRVIGIHGGRLELEAHASVSSRPQGPEPTPEAES
jgi:branched-chain amino acid transport system ATP-binding protein